MTARRLSSNEVRRLRVLLGIAAAALVIGITAPLLTIEKFLVVHNTFSLISAVVELARNGQYLLFAILFAFSIALPALKLWVLFQYTRPAARRHPPRYLRLMHDYGRWSMLDVFVVAVLVVAGKLGAIASVQVNYGLFAFAAAILITLYVTERVVEAA